MKVGSSSCSGSVSASSLFVVFAVSTSPVVVVVVDDDETKRNVEEVAFVPGWPKSWMIVGERQDVIFHIGPMMFLQ